MSNNVLSIEKVNKSFGKIKVLHDISFEVQAGEIVGFIGPNGAGKSTTMKCISGLIFPDSGTIRICDYDIKSQRTNALSNQAALIESPGLFTEMTGRENIRLIANLRGVNKSKIKEIEEFSNLTKSLDLKVYKYSMGMKQRLALAIALLTSPKLLVLDEPTNGLDPSAVFKLRETLIDLASINKTAILFPSHQLGEIEKLSNRIVCIKDGRIIETPTDLNKNHGYSLMVDNTEKAVTIIEKHLESEKYSIDNRHIKVYLKDKGTLPKLINSLSSENVNILEIDKIAIDIEKVYKEVYYYAKTDKV